MEILYLAAFSLKSYFKLLEVFENITFILNNIDFRDIGKVIFKGYKVLTPIKIFRDNRVINIIIDKLY